MTANVQVNAKEPTASPWASLLLGWAPTLLIVGFWLFFMRQMQSGGNKALSRSARAKPSFRRVRRKK